jgi:DNA-binding NarL/FixJ family response regulator
MPTRILLADDHTLFRRGLRRILEDHPDFTVIGEAATGLQAVEMTRLHKPDVALVDVGMKELTGIAATTQMLKHSPNTAVLILSMHQDERFVVRSLKAGARGYMLKDSLEDTLFQAIRMVQRGEFYFSPALVRFLRDENLRQVRARKTDDGYELLTDRERQLYHLLADGNCNKDIASRLNLSLHTVETHRNRIMEKLGLHGIAELIIDAVRRGNVLPY